MLTIRSSLMLTELSDVTVLHLNELTEGMDEPMLQRSAEAL
jgi:hypothetical protein